MASGVGIPTTAQEWLYIQQKIELQARSPYSNKDKRVLWCQGIAVLLGGVLYLTSLLRRATLNGFWCIKRDLEGYWHPNVHVAIPLVTIVHAAIQTASIGLVVIADAPESEVPTIVALNLIACSLLYFAGWTKVWAVLYALPSSIFRLRRRDVLGSTAMITKRRISSPTIFNRFILCGYLVGLLPIPSLSFTVYWVQKILERLQSFRTTSQNLIFRLSVQEDIGTNLLMALKTGREINNLKSAQEQALKNLRIFSGTWLAISLGGLFIFLGGSIALILALTSQIEILAKIQKQRERLLAGINSDPVGKSANPSKTINSTGNKARPSRRKLFSRLKTWVPNFGEDDDDNDLLGMQPRTTPPAYHVSRPDDILKGVARHSYLYEETAHTNKTTRKNHKRLVNYCVRFAWQAVFCTLIATSYIVLNVFVVFNVLDAPRSISLSHLLRTIEQWAAWSWGGGPGAVLGLLACVVAFSKNPTLPQEPQKGPPAATDAYIEQDSDIDEEGDYGRGGGPHVLTAEKLHMHGASKSTIFPASPERPQAALTSLSGVGSWNRLCSRMGLGTAAHNSISTPSRNQASSSEASTRTSRNRSPFQILSLTDSNFVRMSPAKQQAVTQLTTTGSHYRPSHLLNPESNRTPHSSSLRSTPTFQSSGTSQSRVKRSYAMPVQISRSQSSDIDSFLWAPSMQNPGTYSPAPGHFEAIHQLRERN